MCKRGREASVVCDDSGEFRLEPPPLPSRRMGTKALFGSATGTKVPFAVRLGGSAHFARVRNGRYLHGGRYIRSSLCLFLDWNPAAHSRSPPGSGESWQRGHVSASPLQNFERKVGAIFGAGGPVVLPPEDAKLIWRVGGRCIGCKLGGNAVEHNCVCRLAQGTPTVVKVEAVESSCVRATSQ